MSRRLTYVLDGVRLVDCPVCGQAARVDQAGGRLAVRCYAGCQEPAVMAALAPDVDQILAEISANGSRPDSKEPDLPAPDDRYQGRILDVRDLLAGPDEPIPWRCDRFAADGCLTVLAGRGGEGKSWLALALACGVARGEAAAGIACAKGRALIFDAENGAKLIGRRFRAAGVAPDLPVQPVEAGGLNIVKDLDWFRRLIVETGARLVVFDSLRVLSSGAKENVSDEMEPIITALKQLARETGAAVVLVHHRGRSEESDFRGSSVILDQCDLLFTLAREKGDPEGRTRRKVTTIKCRVDEEPEPRWVAIEADSARGLVFVNEAESYDGPGRPRDDLRDQVLEQLGGIGRSQASIARAVGRDPKDQSVRRVLRDLEDDGLAVRADDGWRGVSALTPLGVDTPDTPHTNGSVEPNRGVSGGLPPDTPENVVELPRRDSPGGCSSHPDEPRPGCRYCGRKAAP
jgi:nucleotide-binding universal stress UspA family protein